MAKLLEFPAVKSVNDNSSDSILHELNIMRLEMQKQAKAWDECNTRVAGLRQKAMEIIDTIDKNLADQTAIQARNERNRKFAQQLQSISPESALSELLAMKEEMVKARDN